MPEGSWTLLFAAFSLALIASLSVLFVGEVMGQAPCNLCWFQRVFMFPSALVLGIAAFRSDASGVFYGIALAAGGLLVAGFQVLLYAGVIPEAIEPCGTGPSCSSADMIVLGVPLPVMSLATFTVAVYFGRASGSRDNAQTVGDRAQTRIASTE